MRYSKNKKGEFFQFLEFDLKSIDMAFLDLYQSSEHRNNVAHFAAIVGLALVDGELDREERILVNRFAKKLDITDDEYNLIIENPSKYPLVAYSKFDDRLEHLYDFFKIIYADNRVDESEQKLILKYAIGLGFSTSKANSIIEKSIKIFNEGVDFEYYSFLIDKTN